MKNTNKIKANKKPVLTHTHMHARTHTHTHRNKVSAKARKSYKDAANVDAASLPLRERKSARGGVAAADLLCEKAKRESEEGEDRRERVRLGERA